MPFLNACSFDLELFLSISVLYYVMFYVLWTPGRVAASFATANGDPNNTEHVTKQFQQGHGGGTEEYIYIQCD